MEKEKQLLMGLNQAIDSLLARLKMLEEEKKDILSRYSEAKEDEIDSILQQMQESEEKFRLVYEEMNKLSSEIEQLKKEYLD